MKIKNTSNKLIVLNYLENGKTRKSLPLGAGCETENEHLTKEDVAFYVKKQSIVILEDAGDSEANKNKVLDPITLPDEKSIESLKQSLTIEEMRRYCKDNKIKGITGKDETELATMILESLGIKSESENDTSGSNE